MPPRADELRLNDVKAAISNIREYVESDPSWSSSAPNRTWDAILWNFAMIGEAIKGLSQEVRDLVPEGEWSEAAKMRDVIIHRYFANDPSIIKQTIERDLPQLEAAVDAVLSTLPWPDH